MATEILIRRGYKSTMPTSAGAGEPLFTLDTRELFVGSGGGTTPLRIDWGNILNVPVPARVTISPVASGNFTVAHGLGYTPLAVVVQMTSGGQIWFQSPTLYDSTYLYLVASDADITAIASCFH